MKTAEEIVSGFLFKRIGTEEAYNLGYDCGINGPNLTNCNFKIFSTPENTKAWERGKKDGENSKH